MIDRTVFLAMLARRARVDAVSNEDILFGAGLDISSIAFTEFIMEVEEAFDLDIDPDQLDDSIKTAGDLYTHLDGVHSAQN